MSYVGKSQPDAPCYLAQGGRRVHWAGLDVGSDGLPKLSRQRRLARRFVHSEPGEVEQPVPGPLRWPMLGRGRAIGMGQRQPEKSMSFKPQAEALRQPKAPQILVARFKSIYPVGH
jgi:hypothetical protein